MKRTITTLVFTICAIAMSAQTKDVNIHIYPEQGRDTINKNIYGQFSEHLGHCIYGGIWVGEDSKIPNTKGYRNDVLEALKNLKIPVLRWPGGCFADEYHWMNGIGPKEQRAKMVNTHWGGVVEDNSFGTHEFLDFCEIIGCEPYICGNLGSGTIEEMSNWVEYINSDDDNPMANLRRKNGRDKPWNVKYFGVGNENWGCGGNMTAEYYSDQYRRYATYCRNYGDNRLYKIACGANSFDYNWTEVMMKNVGRRMNGLSLHNYTGPGEQRSATDFNDETYYITLRNTLRMDELLQKNCAIMDKYDEDKRIGLMVDEWGMWYDVEPGTNPGFLYQQNTMRDAIVAALNFNIFHKYADRVRMTNIAQMVNVLQAMILTDEEKMLLTPTYHIFEMYNVHQDALYLPTVVASDMHTVEEDMIPTVSATASRKDGITHVSVVNIDLKESREVTIDLSNQNVKSVIGRILTSKNIQDHNTFDKPDVVEPIAFNNTKIEKGKIKLTIPAKSIIALEVK